MPTVALGSPCDREGFFAAIAALRTTGVAWDEVDWLVDPNAKPLPHRPSDLAGLPQSFIDTANAALLHRDADRFLRVHRMAQRLWRDPRHADDVLHPEHVHLQNLERQVRRDKHKMKAFVRFTAVGQGEKDGQVGHVGQGGQVEQRSDDAPAAREYVAWFEPDHHIVRAVAPFFARRFATMRWSILTPLGSVRWDGASLTHGPAATPDQAPPPDAGEALWLTYYARIFNPARVKVAAMKREMPVRYWKNLPEAQLIAPLLSGADARVATMIGVAEPAFRTAKVVCQHAASTADNSTTLRGIAARVLACDACECASRATQAVPGEGPDHARIVIVGEQPGDREDLEGRPFVGPSGALLWQALNSLGVQAQDVYVTNAVKHFNYDYRGKRRMHKTPGQREIQQCSTWLEQELNVLRPERILALGTTARDALLALPGFTSRPSSDARDAMSPEVGRSAQGAPVYAALHPSALLRRGDAPGSAGYALWVESLGRAVGGLG